MESSHQKDFYQSIENIRQTIVSVNHLKKNISLQKEDGQSSLKYILYLFECNRGMLEECSNHAKSRDEKRAIKETCNLIKDETKKFMELKNCQSVFLFNENKFLN